MTAAAGPLRGHAQSATGPPPATPEKTASTHAPAAVQQPTPPAANADEEARKQEIASECSDLLKMAKDLKAEVDKSTKDTLSVTVVRKASEIEQLAHRVRIGAPRVEASHAN
jgi:type VI protein secretion system component VasF